MTIKTDYSKTFSYARMQNGIPAIRSITLRNTGNKSLANVRLTIDFDPAFSSRYEAVLSEVPKGKTILDNVKVLSSASFLANLTERMEGVMTVTTESEDGNESERYPVSLLPYDFWEGINDALNSCRHMCFRIIPPYGPSSSAHRKNCRRGPAVRRWTDTSPETLPGQRCRWLPFIPTSQMNGFPMPIRRHPLPSRGRGSVFRRISCP